MSLDDILDDCRERLEGAEYADVKRWREKGGKVLGHFQVYFPEEIAHASGMLPVKVRGAAVEPRQADSRFGSYLCSILKTSLELGMSRRLELDLFVTHPICDAARNLAAVWGRNFPYPAHILYLPQNANSAHAAEYLRAEYERMRDVVAGIAGRRASDEDMRRSIGVFNENRRLIRRLYDLKRERPWLLSVYEAALLVSAGGMMPREDHNAMLAEALKAVEGRTARPQDKLRVVLVGGFCEQPPLDLLRVLSESCYVVDDDLMIGLRWILEDVPLEGDPMRNLAVSYLERSAWSPVQHDLRKTKEHMLLDMVKRGKAEAVVVAAAKMCEPGLEDQVVFSKGLEEAGIPYFVTEFEENMSGFESLAVQLETFAENLLFD